MNYLISGANGFVGQQLTKTLLENGQNVSVIIRESAAKDFCKEFPLVKIHLFKEDYTKKELVSILDESDVFFLLSGMKGIKNNNLFVKESIDINILFPKKVLEASLDSKIKIIVFLSSEKAYSKSGVYGASKYIIEKLFSQYSKLNNNCKYKVVRCGNIAYSKNSLMCIWRECLLSNKELTISNGNATKFLCSVSDCAEYLLQAHNYSDEVFIPQMKSVSLKTLLEEMISKFNPDFSNVKEAGLFEEEEMCEYLSEDYNSDQAQRLTKEEIKKIINEK